jgi:hypothetical protein
MRSALSTAFPVQADNSTGHQTPARPGLSAHGPDVAGAAARALEPRIRAVVVDVEESYPLPVRPPDASVVERMFGFDGARLLVARHQPGRGGRPSARHLRGQVVEDRTLAVALGRHLEEFFAQADGAVAKARRPRPAASGCPPRSAARRPGTPDGAWTEIPRARRVRDVLRVRVHLALGRETPKLRPFRTLASIRPATVVSARD